MAHDCLLRWWSPDRNSSTPVQSSTGQPQSTARKSWTLLKTYGRHVGILVSNMTSQSGWELPILVFRPETPRQQLEEIWSDLATHNHPTATQEAMKTLAWSSVADSRWTEPIHQTCDTRSRALSDDGQNFLQLKQKTCHGRSETDHHLYYAMISGSSQRNETWNQCGMVRVCSDSSKYIIRGHYVPTQIILTTWWWYLQISRSRWNSLNSIRPSVSWYRYPSIPYF